MPSSNPPAEQGPDDGPPHVSFQNDVTVIEENGGGKNGGDDNNEDDDASSATPVPLHHSTRLKGYMTLFVSALYNYMAALDKLHGDAGGIMDNMCIVSAICS